MASGSCSPMSMGRSMRCSDVCGHKNAPLSRGRLNGYELECPLHFAHFDVRTGKLIDGPISTDVPAYEVVVAADTSTAAR